MIHDYWELTKPRLTGLSLISAAVGFFLASRESFPFLLFAATMLGTGLTAAGSMTLNQWMERNEDKLMKRTENRPLPAGRLRPLEACVFGIFLVVTGLGILMTWVNYLAAFISALTVGTYLFVYTPLKKKTVLCTIIGAIPGALPPLLGWAAVRGELSWPAWVLFAIVFLWQMPHFYSIAWMFRQDYSNAGFQMLSVNDPTGDKVGHQILYYTIVLVPISLLPTFLGLTDGLYLITAGLLGLYLIWLSWLCLKGIEEKAKPLFRTSIAYLTLLFIMMVIDKG